MTWDQRQVNRNVEVALAFPDTRMRCWQNILFSILCIPVRSGKASTSTPPSDCQMERFTIPDTLIQCSDDERWHMPVRK